MNFLEKLKETLISTIPIVILVLVLNFSIAPLNGSLTGFLIGSVFLVLGLSLFLTGTEIGMVPVGEKLGSVLAHKSSLPLMLFVGFCIGFGVTYAEPDVTVLALQVHSLNPAVHEKTLVLLIAVGLGLFVDIALLRVLKGIQLRFILVFFYSIVLVVMQFVGQSMASISFDASGATTGPLAVPFLLALGLGVSSADKDGKDNSFGLTGIASIGPILAVGVLALAVNNNSVSAISQTVSEGHENLNQIFVSMIKKTATGFGPLAGIIVILQLFLLKFPKVKFRKICLGVVYSFVGIVLFLTGVEYGFSSVGKQLGMHISQNCPMWVTLLVALAFGAIVVCAEPAVWVLTSQVEEVSAGRIKKGLVMVFLCIGVSLAVCLAILRIYLNINYLSFVLIGIGFALVLTFFTPQLFTGIAFDSGGVASGPLSTSFLLSFAMGVSGSAEMGFGLVGLIAISPLISIQILGVLFSIKEKKIKKRGQA